MVTQPLYMNNSEPPLPKDASPQIWSKLIQPFLRRSQQEAQWALMCSPDNILNFLNKPI